MRLSCLRGVEEGRLAGRELDLFPGRDLRPGLGIRRLFWSGLRGVETGLAGGCLDGRTRYYLDIFLVQIDAAGRLPAGC